MKYLPKFISVDQSSNKTTNGSLKVLISNRFDAVCTRARAPRRQRVVSEAVAHEQEVARSRGIRAYLLVDNWFGDAALWSRRALIGMEGAREAGTVFLVQHDVVPRARYRDKRFSKDCKLTGI